MKVPSFTVTRVSNSCFPDGIAAGGLARARLGIAADERSLTGGHDAAILSPEGIASLGIATFRLCIAADRRQLAAFLDLIAAAYAPEAKSLTTLGFSVRSLRIVANGNDLAAFSNSELSIGVNATIWQ